MGDYTNACSRFRGKRKCVWMKFLEALRDFHTWLKGSEHTEDSNHEFWAVELKIPSETLALPASTPTNVLTSASQHVLNYCRCLLC